MRGWAGLEARGIATRVNEQSEGRGEREITVLESNCCDRCVRVHKPLL